MNIKKFMPKIAFAIVLISLSVSAEGLDRIAGYVLAGIIASAAIVLLFENVSSRPTWKSFVRWADDLDLTYVAFGLGLMLISSKFSSITWVYLLLLVSGALFAAAGIGKLIGVSGAEAIKKNAKSGIVIGVVFVIIGAVVCILTWNAIAEDPLYNIPIPLFLVGVGSIFIWAAWRKLHKKRGVKNPPQKSD